MARFYSRSRSCVVLTMVLLVAAALALAACGSTKSPSNNMNPKSYGHDGYMGLSNSNPHIPNRNGNYINYGADGNFAERKLKEMGGIADYNVTFQGPNLYVTLKAAPGVDETELRHKAMSTLRLNFPRYTVHVKTHK